MSDSVGSVSVDVVPDASGWAEKLRAQIRDVTVKVKADTTEAREQIQTAARNTTAKIKVSLDDDIKAKLATLQAEIRKKTLELGVSTSAAQTKIAALQTELANLKAGNADIDDTAAKAKIAEIQAQIKSLKGQLDLDTAPAREAIAGLKAEMASTRLTAEIKAQADTGEAEAELDATARTRTAKIKVDVDKSALSRFDSFLGGMSALPALAIAAGAALIPLAGAIGGVVAALAAPLTIAAGGAGLFAFLGGLAVAQTEKQLKQIDTLEKHLSTLTKGTAAYAQAQKQIKAAQAALGGPQERFATTLEGLQSSFAKFLRGPGGAALLDPITQALQLATDLLPKLTPIISAVGGAFSTLLTQLGDSTKSKGFEEFVQRIAHQVGPDLLAFAHIFGNLAQGIGGLFTAMDRSGFSGGVLTGLERLTHNFAEWGNSKAARHDVREFFDYAHRVGPQVADTLGAIARAAGRFVEALAPLGPPVLHVVQGIADAISHIPIPVLTALAGAFVGLTALQKVGGLKALGALGGLAGARGGGGIAGVLGGVQKVFVVNMPPGGIGGGGVGGQASRFGKYAPIAAGVGQGGLLGLFAAFDVWAGNRIVHQVAKSESQYAFGHAAPTVGVDETPWQIAHGPHLNYGKMMMEANGSLTSITNHWDAVKAHAASASRQIDMVGPHAAATFGQADKAIDTFRTKWDAIHDKQLRIILQDQAAVRELERIQAMRINDKYFNIYARNQAIERTVGPGGGMGHPALTSSGSGGGGAGVTYTGPITVNAQDHADMQRQMQRRQRQAAISGVQVGP